MELTARKNHYTHARGKILGVHIGVHIGVYNPYYCLKTGSTQ